MELDELDMRILRSLQADARTSYRNLAKALKSTTPTVSSRVRRMEGLGIIQGYRAEVDPQALGGTIQVLRLQVRPAGLQRVTEALTVQPGVEEIMALSGGALLLKVRLRPPVVTLQKLHAVIAAQEDILSYDAWEAWNVRQRAPDISVTGLEVKCHECQKPIQGEPERATIAGREHIFCCPICKRTFKERHKALSAGDLRS